MGRVPPPRVGRGAAPIGPPIAVPLARLLLLTGKATCLLKRMPRHAPYRGKGPSVRSGAHSGKVSLQIRRGEEGGAPKPNGLEEDGAGRSEGGWAGGARGGVYGKMVCLGPSVARQLARPSRPLPMDPIHPFSAADACCHGDSWRYYGTTAYELASGASGDSWQYYGTVACSQRAGRRC